MSGSEPPNPVRIAAIGDLHVHDRPADAFLRTVLSGLSQHADVLALCGDLTTLGLAEEANNLAAELRHCTIPIVAVLGNHDHESGQSEELKRILRDANVHFLGEETFTFRNVGFAGVKGFCGGFGRHMLTSFGEEGIKRFVGEALHESSRLEYALQRLNTDKTVVVLHYSPITGTLKGEPPEIFPFLGSSRLAETIDDFEVAAVFHGHAHHGTYEGKTNRGVPVYNACLELLKARNPDAPYVLVEI